MKPGKDVSQSNGSERRLWRLAQAVPQAGEGIAVVNVEGVIEFANPVFCRDTGYTVSELQRLGAWQYLSAGDESFSSAEVHKTLENGRIWNGRHRLARKDGSSFDCLTSIAPLMDREGRMSHCVSVHRDIAGLVRLERQMEDIATMVGGAAQEFNDILADILGHIYLALRDLGEHAGVATRLHAIEEQGYRAVDITQQLLAFARKRKMELVPINLNDCLKAIEPVAAARMPSHIDFSVQVPAEPLIVRGDASMLPQAIMNLLGNVRDGADTVGHPEIRVRLEALRGTSGLIEGISPVAEMPECERYACIRVRHSGHVMDADDAKPLFEAFMTGKASSGVLELDLAMVKGCVEMHMGQISVVSEPGQATEFTIILPCSDHVRVQDGKAQAVVPARGEMILLVDGKDGRRKVIKDKLVGLGFAVLATDDIQEAERTSRKAAHVLDLAVVDLDTPGLGEDAAVHIRSRRPDIPVLFMTGHDDHLLAEHWTRDGAAMLVHKQTLPDGLVHAVRRLIKRGDSGRVEPRAQQMREPKA